MSIFLIFHGIFNLHVRGFSINIGLWKSDGTGDVQDYGFSVNL